MPSLDPEGIDGIFPLRGGERVQARDAMPGIASIHLEGEHQEPEPSPPLGRALPPEDPLPGARVRVDAPPPLVLPLPELPFQLANGKGNALRKGFSVLVGGVLILGLVLWWRGREERGT